MGENRPTISTCHAGISKRVRRLKCRCDGRMTAMDVYIYHKFGGLLSSTSAVTAAQLYTAGIDQHSD